MPKPWWPFSRKKHTLLGSAPNDDASFKRSRQDQLVADYARFQQVMAEAEQLAKSDPVAAARMISQLSEDIKASNKSGGRKRSRARRARKTIRF